MKRSDHCTNLSKEFCDCDWCRVIAAPPKFIETRAYDFNGILGRTADGKVWYLSDASPAYEVSAILWRS